MENIIIPFGQYKGEQLSKVYEENEDYLIWCQNQPWFKDKYSNIYNIVINQNNKSNDSKTPEHNKIQNLFLDEVLCKKLIKKIQNGYVPTGIKVEFEGEYNWDVVITNNNSKDRYYFSQNDNTMRKTYIEIKPTLGDDYPNVLRKMKNQKKKSLDNRENFNYDGHIFMLIINNYDSVNTSKDNLKKIFRQSDIPVLFLEELDIHLKKYLSIEDENKILKEYLLSIGIEPSVILKN